MEQVPKNNRFRKTRSRLGQENPKKEVEPIAPTRKLSHKQNILYIVRGSTQVKLNLNKKISPSPTKPGRSVHRRVPADQAIPTKHPGAVRGVCVVCVFFPFILDVKFVGRTSRGHTGGRSRGIYPPPSFCGACLNFYREKDSTVPFLRRP